MVSVRWLGHSCFRIKNEESIIIDPHDGHYLGLKPPDERGDIILVTHDHTDHNQYKVVQKEGSRIIREAGRIRIGNIEIEGFNAFHDNQSGKKRGDVVIYSLEVEGIRMCHMGDIGHQLNAELSEHLRGTDILFIPVGGTYTVDADGAWNIVDSVKPRVVVPMHYMVGGLSLRIDPVERFLEARDVERSMVGNEIKLTKDDLPEKLEIWVFSL